MLHQQYKKAASSIRLKAPSSSNVLRQLQPGFTSKLEGVVTRKPMTPQDLKENLLKIFSKHAMHDGSLHLPSLRFAIAMMEQEATTFFSGSNQVLDVTSQPKTAPADESRKVFEAVQRALLENGLLQNLRGIDSEEAKVVVGYITQGIETADTPL